MSNHNLRIRTGYSFRVAAGFIDDAIKRLVDVKSTVAPITDRASTFGFVKWDKAARKAGLRPIFGVEFAVSPNPQDKKPNVDYWTFLAIDELLPLHELLHKATSQFRYEPLLDYQQAQNAQGVIKLVGRRAKLELIENRENLYVIAAPSAAPAYLRAAQNDGFQFVSSSENFYPCRDDEGFYQVVVGRGAATQTWPQHILDKEEYENEMSKRKIDDIAKPALWNAAAIADVCQAKLKKSSILVPERRLTLREMCVRGAATLHCDLTNEVYRQRLETELELIELKKFEDYFYLVADVVTWARARMCVGPGRGSSCGSLVCYLLKITTVDPIKFNLLGERFFDLNRPDLPDIDIDFSDQKRDLVFSYMTEKYGAERVARLGTVALFKSASAMKEASGALGIPQWKSKGVIESLTKRSSGDARAGDVLIDALNESDAGKRLVAEYPEILIAGKMEGHPRHFSQHAAGIVLTNRAVNEFIGVDARSGATHCDKKDAETLDLLKIDALGLTQLSVFEDALALLGLPHDYLDSVPLDDKAAYDILNNRRFAGIFQFTGEVLRRVASQVHFENLEDVVAVTALARPGPITSGGTTKWIRRKAGLEKVEFPHPLFEPYTGFSFGVICYQEQIMKIGRGIGDLPWTEVSEMRRAMSKSMGKEYFERFGAPWRAGAMAKGVPEDVVNKAWEDLCAFGAWSFNRSHAVAYGIVSYWCMWLKANHPAEFAAASLQHEADADKQINFLKELNEEGLTYIPADKELSTDRWTVGNVNGKKMLIGPLHNIVGMGPKTVAAVMSAKARSEKLTGKAAKLLDNPVTKIDSLWPIRDGIARIMPDPRQRNIYSQPISVREALTREAGDEVLLFVTFVKINPRNENEYVHVTRRGYEYTDGFYESLVLAAVDDTGTINAKVNRKLFTEIGRPIIDRGRPSKALYAIKGKIWRIEDFAGVSVTSARYIGDLDMKAMTNVA